MLRPVVFLLAAAVSAPAVGNSTHLVAIKHVNVIDVSRGVVNTDVTIVIENERILRVGRHVRVPPSAEIVEASGKFVIPGLWDMHVHSRGYDEARSAFPKLIAVGITGIRDMGSPLDDVLRLRRDVASGLVLGPEMFVAGPLLNGPLPFRVPFILSVASPDDARAAVDRLRKSGVDFIKVHDALAAPEYEAIAHECRRLGVPYAGHIPPAVDVGDAISLGQRSIEHLGGRFYGLMLACSREQQTATSRVRAVVASARRDLEDGRDPDDSDIFRADLTKLIGDEFEWARAEQLLTRLRENAVWQCPTLVSLPLRTVLSSRTDLSAEDVASAQRLLQRMYDLIRAMARSGIGILAGTDAPLNTGALHDELELLVAAGLTPLQALQAATIRPTQYLGVSSFLGTVSAGKVANLVILEANPIVDIRNTRTIVATILRGRYIKVERTGNPAGIAIRLH